MMPNFYLFLPCRNSQSADLNSIELSWVKEDANGQLQLSQGKLSDAANASTDHYITVVLAGEDVLYSKAEVPGNKLHRILQAIPYILEDSVIDDVEELYFAIAKDKKDSSDNQYNVSIINKDYFKLVVKSLENSGINADEMQPDYLLLGDSNKMLFDADRVVFNSPKVKFSSSVDSSIILDESCCAENSEVELINFSKGKNKHLNKIIENMGVNEESSNVPALLYLIKNKNTDKSINLLQGKYKKTKNWSQAGKKWMPVAALFLVWLCVQGGLFISDYISLSKQNNHLNTEITKIYKKTFPQSRRIIDAKAQMQQKLTSLKKRRGQSGRSFTEMLSASASALSKTNGLVIKSLRYYDGRINLEIQVASLQTLDNLKDQLNKENGYQVEIQNASSGKETVTARIQIIGASS